MTENKNDDFSIPDGYGYHLAWGTVRNHWLFYEIAQDIGKFLRDKGINPDIKIRMEDGMGIIIRLPSEELPERFENK